MGVGVEALAYRQAPAVAVSSHLGNPKFRRGLERYLVPARLICLFSAQHSEFWGLALSGRCWRGLFNLPKRKGLRSTR